MLTSVFVLFGPVLVVVFCRMMEKVDTNSDVIVDNEDNYANTSSYLNASNILFSSNVSYGIIATPISNDCSKLSNFSLRDGYKSSLCNMKILSKISKNIRNKKKYALRIRKYHGNGPKNKQQQAKNRNHTPTTNQTRNDFITDSLTRPRRFITEARNKSAALKPPYPKRGGPSYPDPRYGPSNPDIPILSLPTPLKPLVPLTSDETQVRYNV